MRSGAVEFHTYRQRASETCYAAANTIGRQRAWGPDELSLMSEGLTQSVFHRRESHLDHNGQKSLDAVVSTFFDAVKKLADAQQRPSRDSKLFNNR
jgi:hypothetical protein